MCISFFYINEKCTADEFRFILIFNRDEYYSRETANAHFWDDFPNILAGRDLQSEERGTWLGVTTSGKVGALLNIHDKPLIPNAPSRGVLINEYFKGDADPRTYIEELEKSGKAFNGYNLLLFDLMAWSFPALLHSSTKDGQNQETVSLTDGIYGISNSPIKQPFKKVSHGQQRFENVVEKFNNVAKRKTLIEELLLILKSETKNFPDSTLYEMKKYSMEESKIEKLSSIFVSIPEANYGTRTHTIMTVTRNNVGYFDEFTRIFTQNEGPPEWIHNQFNINFKR